MSWGHFENGTLHKVTHNFRLKIRNILEFTACPVKFGTTCPRVIVFTCNRLTATMFEIFMLLTSPRIRYKDTCQDNITVYCVEKGGYGLLRENWESKILLGVEDNAKLDLWSSQLMPSQSTERKRSWYSPTRLVGEGTLPWLIFRFRIFSNYFAQKFEKIKITVWKSDNSTKYGHFRLDLY